MTSENDDKAPIPVTDELVGLLEELVRQRDQLETQLNLVVAAAGAALCVPKGWIYVRLKKAYVPPDVLPAPGPSCKPWLRNSAEELPEVGE